MRSFIECYEAIYHIKYAVFCFIGEIKVTTFDKAEMDDIKCNITLLAVTVSIEHNKASSIKITIYFK